LEDVVSVVAVIPARENSKRIPRKNIRELYGKPMLWYTLDAAYYAKRVSAIVVTSEHEDVLECAVDWLKTRRLATEQLILVERPPELSRDNVEAYEPVAHAVRHCAHDSRVLDLPVAMLLPTSPLRKSYHIDEAIGIWRGLGTECLHVDSVTVKTLRTRRCPRKNSPLIERGTSVFFDGNGAIKIGSAREALFGFESPGVPYVMSPESGIDVDVEEEWEHAERELAREADL
jgi:N-acylneuraminate cytidylyltransferase/CMP-N,N'-diacetyllegionaminic acid synthase